MLRRLSLSNFVIVSRLDVDFGPGFAVLTGETGAGKSILIDALQIVLGGRGDAGVVREGENRAEIAAEFEPVPPALAAWLDEAGLAPADEAGAATLLLRRTVDAQGKSRAWINGSAVTVAQLRETAEHLVDIHGQHAWQSLTRPAAVRQWLDDHAEVDTGPMLLAWQRWREQLARLEAAERLGAERERERERLVWQIGEVERLAPGADEWPELNAEHQRLAHAQAILDAVQLSVDAVHEGEAAAGSQAARALEALETVAGYEPALAEVIEVLAGAQAQLADAARSLQALLRRTELEPDRLAELDARLSAWIGLARRFRCPPPDLAAQLAQWQAELAELDAATDLEALQRQAEAARAAFIAQARQVSARRQAAAPGLAEAVTAAMQQLGMAGGRFAIALETLAEPQAHGLESIEFLVAGHAGSTPRPLAKVASGGELSRLALAIAVTTGRSRQARGLGAGTLIFDEIDSGVGGAVGDTVGRLMRQLGQDCQVLAVTHLAQVAACADTHLVVSKAVGADGRTRSEIHPVAGAQRVGEIARMIGGQSGSGAGLAHAQDMLAAASRPAGHDTVP